jgi:hypothetical protein
VDDKSAKTSCWGLLGANGVPSRCGLAGFSGLDGVQRSANESGMNA